MSFIPTGGINADNIGEYMAFGKVAACGGSWMVPSSLVSQGRFDGIRELTRKAVLALHGFSIHHIAFNCGNEERAAQTAKAFSWEPIMGKGADHAGTWVECMKTDAKGDTGHIAVAVNSIARAKAYMQLRGIQFEEQTQPQVCWLKDEIMGFGLQIVDPKLM